MNPVDLHPRAALRCRVRAHGRLVTRRALGRALGGLAFLFGLAAAAAPVPAVAAPGTAAASPAPGTAAVAAAAATARPVVLFFGDSLTAGYGVGKAAAFPALVQTRADSAGCGARVVNAGLPGETSAAGRRRVDWILRQPIDVFVLELGGNDGLRGVPLAETERNLNAILERVRATAPQARLVVVGVRLPPNLGPDYTEGFQAIFPRVAEAWDAVLIPRLLAGVGGDRALMRGDGIHPNEAGHRRVADTVWTAIAPLLCDAEDPAAPLAP